MPFQLSGGMCQRVALAAALARDPELLIADEPSTALDVTTQAEIIRLLKRVQVERGMSLILITHDLRLAFSTCDRVCVLYAGSLLEVGAAADVERDPAHPYTLGLLLSEPPVEKRVPRLIAIRGSVPSADDVAARCSFADRCDWAMDVCRAGKPVLAEITPGRATACIRRGEIADEMRALRHRALQAADTRPAVATTAAPLIRVDGLEKTFYGRRGRPIHALKGVSIEMLPGRERRPRRRIRVGQDHLGTLSRRTGNAERRDDRNFRHSGLGLSGPGSLTSERSSAAQFRWCSRTLIRRSTPVTRSAAA